MRRRTAAVTRSLSREAADGVGFVVVGLEHSQQLRDRQQVGDPLRQVEQLEAAALPADGGVGADNLAEAGAVDVRHVFEVQHELLASLLHQAVDLVLQQLVAFAERHLAL